MRNQLQRNLILSLHGSCTVDPSLHPATWPPPPFSPPLLWLLYAPPLFFPPIKCTCRSMFTVTFIRRRSAFFLHSHKKFPASPILSLSLSLWRLQLFHLLTPDCRNFLAIYLTASSCRRCCGCKSALAAACHSSNQVLCGCHTKTMGVPCQRGLEGWGRP